MLRKLQAFLVLGLWALTTPAAGQEPTDEWSSPDAESEAADSESPPADESSTDEPSAAEPDEREQPSPDPAPESGSARAGVGLSASGNLAADERTADVDVDAASDAAASDEDGMDDPAKNPLIPREEGFTSGWDTFVSGYFRAPMAMGLSPRPGPDNLDGDPALQVSYGPTRTVDANYFSFAYTRLQEQDWVELFVHAKKKHVEAVVGWMGYWLQAAGFRNFDAGWAPGMAYLTIDSDFDLAGLSPNIALRAGAWWARFGFVRKYDTYTLGQYRQLGEQLKLTVPFGDGFTATVVQGFGTSRDGNFNPPPTPAPYQSQVGLDLIHYEDVELAYKDYVKASVHYNTQWTRDPNLFQSTQAGKAYSDATEAYLKTLGGELTLNVPLAGSLWVSPSYIQVRNGWALAEAGVEVMHSLSGDSLATNYLGWSGSLADSTGSGSLINLGFLYENTLSNLMGEPKGGTPEVTLNVFGLFTDITMDLPENSAISQDRMGQFKYGADIEYQPLDWLGLMLRWDEVNYNLGHAGYVFSAISPRLTFSSHYLSGESIYLQYSRYNYGDAMRLAGRWPWGTPIVAGSDIIQGGAYSNEIPDMDVVRVQASVRF